MEFAIAKRLSSKKIGIWENFKESKVGSYIKE